MHILKLTHCGQMGGFRLDKKIYINVSYLYCISFFHQS